VEYNTPGTVLIYIGSGRNNSAANTDG